MSELITKNDLKDMDFDSAAALPMNEMEDYVGFQQLPEAIYIFDIVDMGKGTVGQGNNEKSAGLIDMKVKSCVELLKDTDAEGHSIEKPAEGTDYQYAVVGGVGVQKFKTEFAEILKAAGIAPTESVSDVFERNALKGISIKGTIVHNTYKKDGETKTAVRLEDVSMA